VPQASDDLQIVVFPARKSVAQENLGKPIENPIADEKVFKVFEESDEGRREKLIRIRDRRGTDSTRGGFVDLIEQG
jgi:hypothetical protein